MAGAHSIDRQQFARDGYAAPVRAFSPDQADALHRRWQDLGDTAALKKPHLLVPWLADLVRHPAIVAPVCAVLGTDVLCWSSLFFAKRPREGAFVAWHQDATYWGLSSADIVTAWLAFTPSTAENGCLRVVPGSHRADVPHRTGQDAGNMLSRNQEIAAEVDETQAVDLVLEPGEMSLHHVKIVHGSQPNQSDQPRIGYAIRYIAGHVRQLSPQRDSATPVAGVDHGHFDPEPYPDGLLGPKARAYHAVMMARQAAIQRSIG